MLERAIVPVGLFVLAFAGLLAYRWLSKQKLEVQLWDGLIAVIPSLIWMIGTGYFTAVELGPNGFKIQRAAEALVRSNDTLVGEVFQPVRMVDFGDVAALVQDQSDVPLSEGDEDVFGSFEREEADLIASENSSESIQQPSELETSPEPLFSPDIAFPTNSDRDFDRIRDALKTFDVVVFRPTHSQIPVALLKTYLEGEVGPRFEIPVEYVVFNDAGGKFALFCKATDLSYSPFYYAGTSVEGHRYYALIQQKIAHPEQLISLVSLDGSGRNVLDSCYVPSQAVSLDQRISEAISDMDRLDRDLLPVTDGSGSLVGLIAQGDIVSNVVIQVLKASEAAD